MPSQEAMVYQVGSSESSDFKIGGFYIFEPKDRPHRDQIFFNFKEKKFLHVHFKFRCRFRDIAKLRPESE